MGARSAKNVRSVASRNRERIARTGSTEITWIRGNRNELTPKSSQTNLTATLIRSSFKQRLPIRFERFLPRLCYRESSAFAGSGSRTLDEAGLIQPREDRRAASH